MPRHITACAIVGLALSAFLPERGFRARYFADAEARGAIFCETAGGKITEMRMYWHRLSGGREI